MQLSTQIASMAINGNFVNSTVPDFTTPPFERPQYAVLINTLWLLSLVIALITASLGILVKQWLHELLSYTTHDPKERLKLRFFREAGLERWKVFAIASALPLLLQLALLLFFIGLGVFFRQQDPVVAWVTTGVMASWLAVFLFTITMPMVYSQCPYKIPMLNSFSHWVRHIRHQSLIKMHKVSGGLQRRSYNMTKCQRIFWIIRDWLRNFAESLDAFEEARVSNNTLSDLPVIIYARDVLRGERLTDSMIECFRGIGHKDIRETLNDISNPSATINCGLLPGTLNEPTQAMRKFLIEVTQENRALSFYFGQDANPSIWSMLHFSLIHLSSRVYSPGNSVLPSYFVPGFIHLIRVNPTSAAFSLSSCCVCIA